MIIEELLSVIGEYTPITIENVLSDGTVITYYTPDFGYILAGTIIVISIYSVFRLLGGFFGGRKKR